MRVFGWARSIGAVLALGGMVACTTPAVVAVGPEAERLDRIWVSMARGDLSTAEQLLPELEDAELSARARLDVVAAREGRAAALVESLAHGGWLPARYLASQVAALERLRATRPQAGRDTALRLELARRASSISQQLSTARALQREGDGQPGAAEARAVEVEALLAAGRWDDARLVLEASPRTARLELSRRRFEHSTARYASVIRGGCDDLRDGLAVPLTLALLEDSLRQLPSQPLERQLRDALEQADLAGAPMLRARERLLAVLEARAGRLDSATARLAGLEPRQPEEDEALRRWLRRQAGDPQRVASDFEAPTTLEERLDGDSQRLAGRDLFSKRLADEWDLAARATYREAAEGDGSDLDGFLERLDEAASSLPGAPALRALPRRSFGVFGTMLDFAPLYDTLPQALLLGGQALFMAPELAWFDRVGCEPFELPDGLGHYSQCRVRRGRVSGRLAAQGVSIAGAGLDRLVWIDLDEVEREERAGRGAPPPRALTALPASTPAERLSLQEPLDVAARLIERARADAGADYPARLLETLTLHERQHIIDFQEFVARGAPGQFWSLLGAGLLPASVRAEIERRAQLRALREAADPRIALAQAVSRLPVEGEARGDEHAVGYAALVAEVLERLDRPRLPDGRRPEELGLDRSRVLLQQLDRVPPETLRDLARSLPD